MKLTQQQAMAVVALMHGTHKDDFRAFVTAVADHTEQLMQNLIYERGDANMLLERRGETRALTEVLRAIEKAHESANPPKPT